MRPRPSRSPGPPPPGRSSSGSYRPSRGTSRSPRDRPCIYGRNRYLLRPPMFRDEAKLKIKAGDGGDGCVSFRREACVPRGGPDGGDGGRGGDVVLVADANYNTLYHLIHQPRFVAQSGEAGFKKNMSGKMGRDLIVHVPVGT